MLKKPEISQFILTRPIAENKGVLSGIVNAASGKITEGSAKVTDEEITLVDIPAHMAEIFTNQAKMNGYKVKVAEQQFNF